MQIWTHLCNYGYKLWTCGILRNPSLNSIFLFIARSNEHFLMVFVPMWMLYFSSFTDGRAESNWEDGAFVNEFPGRESPLKLRWGRDPFHTFFSLEDYIRVKKGGKKDLPTCCFWQRSQTNKEVKLAIIWTPLRSASSWRVREQTEIGSTMVGGWIDPQEGLSFRSQIYGCEGREQILRTVAVGLALVFHCQCNGKGCVNGLWSNWHACEQITAKFDKCCERPSYAAATVNDFALKKRPREGETFNEGRSRESVYPALLFLSLLRKWQYSYSIDWPETGRLTGSKTGSKTAPQAS